MGFSTGQRSAAGRPCAGRDPYAVSSRSAAAYGSPPARGRLRGGLASLALLLLAYSEAAAQTPAPPRRGGGPGGARGADRGRGAQAGRQCGRCRGRDRLRHGGDLSARRQSGRRRLHGDPSRRPAYRCGDRLSGDRAGGGDPRHVSRPERRGRSAQVARFGAGDRGARHGRRTGAGAGALRLGQVQPRRSDRARHRARARRHADRGRCRRNRCRARRAAWRAGRRRRRFSSSPTGSALGPGDTAGAERSGRHARGDRARRAAGLLRGRRRRQAGGGGARRRRHHDGRGSEETTGRCCASRCAGAIAATTSSPCRRHPRAAWC